MIIQFDYSKCHIVGYKTFFFSTIVFTNKVFFFLTIQLQLNHNQTLKGNIFADVLESLSSWQAKFAIQKKPISKNITRVSKDTRGNPTGCIHVGQSGQISTVHQKLVTF